MHENPNYAVDHLIKLQREFIRRSEDAVRDIENLEHQIHVRKQDIKSNEKILIEIKEALEAIENPK